MNAIFAQTIGTVCAKDYVTCPFQIYSSMSLRDHLNQAESYYITEVKALKRILEHKNEDLPLLCFVDEVLRGTNTVERIAASASILQALAEGNGLCFAATHDIELTYLLEGICENYYFQEKISKSDIMFDYQLHKGRAKSRNAIQLLEILGYDKKITTKASQMATRFLESGNWTLS
jgi:DNA mismatch repair ATPase MutS